MKRILAYALLLLALAMPAAAQGQALTLTLQQTIERARDLSPDAQSARQPTGTIATTAPTTCPP